jgi:hypothetical protein
MHGIGTAELLADAGSSEVSPWNEVIDDAPSNSKRRHDEKDCVML